MNKPPAVLIIKQGVLDYFVEVAKAAEQIAKKRGFALYMRAGDDGCFEFFEVKKSEVPSP